MNSIIDLIWGYFSMIRGLNKIFGAEQSILPILGRLQVLKLSFKYILLS
jgi:hypothetical protein